MNLSSISISTQNHIGFKSVRYAHAQIQRAGHTLQTLTWQLQTRLTLKMDGDVLAQLEPRYYRTLETGMTVTEPLASREPRFSGLARERYAVYALAPHASARAKCISLIYDHHVCAQGPTIVHTVLLLCTRPYCCARGSTVLTNPERLQSASFYALQVFMRS